MAMSYEFKKQVMDPRQDEACTAVERHWSSMGFEVRNVSKDETYYVTGIDLIRTIVGQDATNIDVKCDFQAHTTGNVPVELVEIMPRHGGAKRGWAYKKALDEIHYFIWETKLIVPVRREDLLMLAYKNSRKGFATYHEKPFLYFTLGVLVPLQEVIEISNV
jgi:hypothetical protein